MSILDKGPGSFLVFHDTYKMGKLMEVFSSASGTLKGPPIGFKKYDSYYRRPCARLAFRVPFSNRFQILRFSRVV